MTLTRKILPMAAILAIFAVAAALGMVPLGASAADHLDGPGLTPPGGDARLDINDLYVFEGSDPANTVLALTVNPLTLGGESFANKGEGSYHIRIDTDGDAKEDVTYSVDFKDRSWTDEQRVRVRRAEGRSARSLRPKGEVLGQGWTNSVFVLEQDDDWDEDWDDDETGTFFAGLRSDPFFFDLDGFLGTVEGAMNGRMLGDGSETDPFAAANTLAIVIEVPDSWVGTNVGVWATTTERTDAGRVQNDRIGRPAINTVVNSTGPIVMAPAGAKDAFNGALPRNDVADFTGAVVSALQALGGYSVPEAEGLAAILLPDVLTYDTSTAAAGPLNGRALADDVIDIELGLVTNGGIPTDNVGPHGDYQAVFPYLGVPH